ncbi:MAG: hypothetical protein K2W95_09910 [Candidatus Obscuribacterales bacterium]|nr:hypothetical protein [Candidatus Obscuribacterales bacterium]
MQDVHDSNRVVTYMDAEIRLTSSKLLANEATSGVAWWQENLVKPALNTAVLEPWHAVAHTVNAGSTALGGSELFKEEVTYKIKEARLWSPEWLTQNVGSGLAMVVPYGLAALGAKSTLCGLGAKFGATGLTADILKHRTTAMVVGAAAYDGFRVPKEKETRLGNAAAGAAGFLVFELGNGWAQAHKLSGVSLLGARAGTGILGASTQLTISRGIATGELPEAKEYYAAAASGMTMNLVLPKVHEGLEKATNHGRDALGLSVSAEHWLQTRVASENHNPQASPTLRQLMADQPWAKVKDTTGPSEIHLETGQIRVNRGDASAPGLAYALAQQQSLRQAQPSFREAAALLKSGDTAGAMKLFSEIKANAEAKATAAQQAVARELGLAIPGERTTVPTPPVESTVLRPPGNGAKLEVPGEKKGGPLTEQTGKGVAGERVPTAAEMLADLHARTEQGKVPGTDYPSHPEMPTRRLPFEKSVEPLPKLKADSTGVEHVPTDVRRYNVPGRKDMVIIISEEYAARLERYAELKAKAEEPNAQGDLARAELTKPENLELVGRLTPEQAARYLAELPDGTQMREFVMHDHKSPFNAKLREQHGNKTLEATLDSEIGRNRSNSYERQRDAIMMEDLMHEWAHHFEKSRPFEAQMYTLANEMEAAGWRDRAYAGNRRESWAICLGEYVLHPEGSRVLKLAHEAPLRAAVLGEALLAHLEAIPPTERSRNHDVYVQRAKLLQQEALPIARQLLMERVNANTSPTDATNALRMLAYIGDPAKLGSLKGPTVLDLSYFPLSNREMQRIGGMTFLRDLDISGTHATTDGVRSVGQVPLTKLELRGVRFHDYGASSLPRTLRELGVSDTLLTDSAVPSLSKLVELKVLDVSGTKITADGVQRLRDALPDTQIID